MKLFLVLALAASFATAYSVDNVQLKSKDVYTANVNVLGKSKASVSLPDALTITTKGCDHAPAKGATAMIVTKASGKTILFSDGGSCSVVSVQ